MKQNVPITKSDSLLLLDFIICLDTRSAPPQRQGLSSS
jgi:hypothetical protein